MADPGTHPSAALRAAGLAAAALGAVALWWPAEGAGALRADRVGIHPEPAAVRVAVHFSGGTLAATEGRVDAPDPAPGDGRALVRIAAPGIRSAARALSRAGVAVRVVRSGAGPLVVVLRPVTGAAKFVSYETARGGRRLDIRLWRATTSARAAIRDDRCLRLLAVRGGDEPAVRGLELVPVFEHNVAVSLREAGAGGRVLAVRAFTTSGFRFRPDFSGYLRAGRFAGPVPVRVDRPRRVMLEAWVASARDGSLECLVQRPVIIRP